MADHPARNDIALAKRLLKDHLGLHGDGGLVAHEGVLWVIAFNRKAQRDARRLVGPRWYCWPVRVESMGEWLRLHRRENHHG